MVRAGTGSALIQGRGHLLDREMSLGEGRNLSMGQDGAVAGGLRGVQGSDRTVS